MMFGIALKYSRRGAWVVQWVKASAFSSGHDPGVLGSSPELVSLPQQGACLPLSLPASLPTCDLSLCQINLKKKFKCLVEFPWEAIWSWTLVCWETFDYLFNFFAGYGSVQVFYFFLFQFW